MTVFTSSVRGFHHGALLFNHRMEIRQLHTHLPWLHAELEESRACPLSPLLLRRPGVPKVPGLIYKPGEFWYFQRWGIAMYPDLQPPGSTRPPT